MSIFEQLFNLVNTYIFNGAVQFADVADWMPLIAGTMSAFGVVFLFSLPFLLVYWFTRYMAGDFGDEFKQDTKAI